MTSSSREPVLARIFGTYANTRHVPALSSRLPAAIPLLRRSPEEHIPLDGVMVLPFVPPPECGNAHASGFDTARGLKIRSQ